jgi:hypothetical protein
VSGDDFTCVGCGLRYPVVSAPVEGVARCIRCSPGKKRPVCRSCGGDWWCRPGPVCTNMLHGARPKPRPRAGPRDGHGRYTSPLRDPFRG